MRVRCRCARPRAAAAIRSLRMLHYSKRFFSVASQSQHQTIASIFAQSCQKNASATSLISCHQRIRLDYGRLSSVCTAFASALLELKYKRGDRIALALRNDAENLIAQLGCSMIGVSVVTGKDHAHLKKLSAELSCQGLIIDASSGLDHQSPLLNSPSHPTIVTGRCQGLTDQIAFDDLLKSPLRNMPNDIPAELPVAFYGSSKPVTHLDLMKVARTVLMELHLGLWDRVCVPVTLNHTFGFGSGQILWTLVILLVSSRSRIRILMLCALFSPAGALAALTAGSTVVLPGPEKDPNTTLRALDDEGCTVFLTDTHDLVNLRPLRLSGPTSLPWWASASGSEGALRTGLVKIGSGDELGKAPLESWCGVPLVSVGKLPVPG
jgi:acyl-CoA synthetase (AMP-forming)/AMP-acid ligase II